MKNKLAFYLLLISCFSFAQDYKAEFKESFQKNDTLKQKEILLKWEKATPKDAELFTSYYNYYFQKSRKEILSLTTRQPEDEALILTDSLDQTAGYLGSTETYEDSDLNRAFTKIDKGISLYPDRLDMRFGKIYGLGKIEDWQNFTLEIIKTVEYSKKNKNNWTWTNNEKKENGQEFMLLSIQSYQLQLYNTERDDLLPSMRQIATAVLKVYPNNVESLSNLSVTYFLEKEYQKGLDALFKAEKIKPEDYVVLANIAHGYTLLGNKAKSIEYYEKVRIYGDEESKKFAETRIAELKK